jgi:hypothetical protein
MMTDLLDQYKDWRFFLSLYLLDDLWEVTRALQFLEILDQSIAPPEFWGPGDVLVGKYDRREVERYLLANQDPKESRPPLQLKRTTTPRYRANLNVGNGIHPHSFHLNADLRHADGELPQLFSLGDMLASSVNLEFATIDINREGQDPATRMLRSGMTPNLDIYIELGFHTLFVRNYFGARLVRLAGGPQAFTVDGAIVRPFANGALAVDLHATPWLADPGELKAAQQQVLPQLRATTGLFYSTKRPDQMYPGSPGSNWQSPPGARWPK